jgi:hypothetical protein
VEFDAYLEHIREHAAALRAAALKAGPDAVVPTTPGWDVLRLVRHIARVHNWVVCTLDAGPAADEVRAERPPADWDSALAYWDIQVDTMLTQFREHGPDAPARTFRGAGTNAWWARRQAHETAIHRLDAEHAAHGDDVDHLVFDPELAADGIDEVLSILVADRPVEVSGTVLYHAADAGRAWLATTTAGEPPRTTELDSGAESGLNADASVVGTADAVYRAVWKRPSHAVVGGDRTLVDGIHVP